MYKYKLILARILTMYLLSPLTPFPPSGIGIARNTFIKSHNVVTARFLQPSACRQSIFLETVTVGVIAVTIRQKSVN